MIRRILLASVLATSALLPLAAQAATNIDVSLWDKGADMEVMTGMTYGSGPVDMHKATMGIKLSRDRAPAGPVTFKVTNNSKETIHEMIVVPIAKKDQPLPYIDGEKRMDEDAAGHLGEVSELDPGKSGSLTLDLAPGTYMVLCNVPTHYAGGMWHLLTVTP